MKKTILKLAGFSQEIYELCSSDAQLKYLKTGISMFIPMIIAFASCYFLCRDYGTGHFVSFVVAVIGAAFILLVETVLLGTMEPKESIIKNFISPMTFARFGITFAMATLVVAPVEMLFFEDVIEERMAQDMTYIQDSIALEKDQFLLSLDQKISEITDRTETLASTYYNTNVATLVARTAVLEEEYFNEMDGSGGTKKRGIGVIATAKKAQLDQAKLLSDAALADYAEYRNNLHQELESRLEEYKSQQAEAQEAYLTTKQILGASQAKNLFGKQKTFAEIKKEHPEIRFKSIALFLFLFACDLIALFSKAMLTKDDEYYALSAQKALNQLQFKQNEEALNTSTLLDLLEKEKYLERFEKDSEIEIERYKLETDVKKQKLNLDAARQLAMIQYKGAKSKSIAQAIIDFANSNNTVLMDLNLDDDLSEMEIKNLLTEKLENDLKDIMEHMA